MEQLTDEYLTVDVVAQTLGVSREYVYKHRSEYGGFKLGKKTVRFSKKLFNKIMEVKSNGGLQAQGEMDVRLLEERSEIQTGGVPGQTGSDRKGSNSQKYSQSDKYGLREAVRKKIG